MIKNLGCQQIEQLLLSQSIGRLGCSCEGLVYVIPVSYMYDGERILAHSSEGMKVQMMRSNPNVCFQVDQIDDLNRWQSVIAWGTFKELSDDEAALAMSFLVKGVTPTVAGEKAQAHPPPRRGDDRLIIYEIRLKTKTGRYE